MESTGLNIMVNARCGHVPRCFPCSFPTIDVLDGDRLVATMTNGNVTLHDDYDNHNAPELTSLDQGGPMEVTCPWGQAAPEPGQGTPSLPHLPPGPELGRSQSLPAGPQPRSADSAPVPPGPEALPRKPRRDRPSSLPARSGRPPPGSGRGRPQLQTHPSLDASRHFVSDIMVALTPNFNFSPTTLSPNFFKVSSHLLPSLCLSCHTGIDSIERTPKGPTLTFPTDGENSDLNRNQGSERARCVLAIHDSSSSVFENFSTLRGEFGK